MTGRARAARGPGWLLFLPAAAILSCRGPVAGTSGNDSGEDRPAPAAVVGGVAVDRVEFCDRLFEREREAWTRGMGDLLDERLAAAEAARRGLRIPAEVLDRAVEREAAAREKQWREAFGEGADLASAVRRAYGTDIATWRRRILRPRLEGTMLVARVARLDLRGRASLVAKVIVTADAEKAARLAEKLASGADFSLTALRESIDPSARAGGVLPPWVRGESALPGVEARLFAASPGSLVGPLEIGAGPATRWHLYRVVERREPWPASAPDLAVRLERDLADVPPEPWEIERWRERARREAGVKVFAPDGTEIELEGE